MSTELSSAGPAGGIIPTDLIPLSRNGVLKAGTADDILKFVAAGALMNNKIYQTTAAAQADGTLANNSIYMILPSINGGAADFYRKDTGAASTLLGVMTNQALMSAAVLASQNLCARLDSHLGGRALPSKAKPGIAQRIGAFWFIWQVPTHDTGFAQNRGDLVETILFNAGLNITGGICWAVATRRMRVDGAWHEQYNFFSEQNGTGENYSGLQYLTMEFAMSWFSDDVTPSGVTAPFVGPFHGNMDYIAAGSTIFVDGVGANYILEANAPEGTRIHFATSFIFIQNFDAKVKNAADAWKVACRVQLVHQFVTTAEQLIVAAKFDHTHAAVNCVPRLWNSYTNMGGSRHADRLKVAGVSAYVLNNAPGTQTNLGKKTTFQFYHSNTPNVVIEFGLRYGFPQQINDVDDNWANATNIGGSPFNYSFLLEQANDYTKLYIHPFSFIGTNSYACTGKVFRTSCRVKSYRANYV